MSTDETTTQITENEAPEAVEETASAQPEETAQAEKEPDLAELLTAAQKEAQDNLDGWQRTLAEFQNYKKRVDRELRDSYQNAILDTLTNLLPIIDDFERAMSNIPEELQGHTWLDGIVLIHKKFLKLLEDQGVVAIDPVGEPFDPNRHEAVGQDEDTDVESGYVTATLQKGYAVKDRVLRPALVRVAR